jgi:ABC-type enterochelin transport system permease subunit
MTRVGRIVAVTIGLVGAGLLFGAIAGGTSFALVGILTGEDISIEALEIGAIFGAPLGAITAPMLSWLLLRHVPLGKMFLVCSVGTAIGGIVGWFATTAEGDIMLNPLVGAFVGCVIAAITLRTRTRHELT